MEIRDVLIITGALGVVPKSDSIGDKVEDGFVTIYCNELQGFA